jgi:hypothetical protein
VEQIQALNALVARYHVARSTPEQQHEATQFARSA